MSVTNQGRAQIMSLQRFILLTAIPLSVGLYSCEQPYYGSGNVGVRDHSDAVVHINQVDPAYRKHFVDQHDSNYSLSDQRKAYFEAVKNSKKPVQHDAAYASSKSSKKKASSKKSSKKKVVKRKTTTKKSSSKKSSKKSTAKKSTSRKRR